MSKLIFPYDGVYPHCRKRLDSSLRNLQKAVSDCLFDIPSDFPYRGYLYELQHKINLYRRELNKINATLRLVDQRFNYLSDSLYLDANKIDIPKFTERERLIV